MFQFGYRAERINASDEVHRIESIIKVVAGKGVPKRSRSSNRFRANRSAQIAKLLITAKGLLAKTDQSGDTPFSNLRRVRI